jgi:hypothetical protein
MSKDDDDGDDADTGGGIPFPLPLLLLEADRPGTLFSFAPSSTVIAAVAAAGLLTWLSGSVGGPFFPNASDGDFTMAAGLAAALVVEEAAAAAFCCWNASIDAEAFSRLNVFFVCDDDNEVAPTATAVVGDGDATEAATVTGEAAGADTAAEPAVADVALL